MKPAEAKNVKIVVLPFLIPTWAAGQTWGHHIFLSQSYVDNSWAPSTRLIAHELVHVDQWQMQGWKFPFKYAYQLLVNGYENNSFEVEARKWENTDEYQSLAETVLDNHEL